MNMDVVAYSWFESNSFCCGLGSVDVWCPIHLDTVSGARHKSLKATEETAKQKSDTDCATLRNRL